MNCASCGFSVPEGASFCPNCGASQLNVEPQPLAPVDQPVVVPAAAPVQPAAAPVDPQPAAAQQPAFQQPVAQPQIPDAAPQMPPTAASGFQGSQQAGPQASYQAPPVYAKGCIAAALDDIKSQPDAAKKMAFLGLLGCVPILNFVVTGYAVNWSREVPFGAKSPLPKKVVTGQNFEMGFYAFLVALVIGLVVGLAASLLALVPLVGWLAAIVLSFGASMYQYLAYMRMGMLQQLGEGFKIQLIWNVMQRDWKTLFCAALVPSLVVGLIVSVLATVISLVAAGTGAAAVMMAEGGMGGVFAGAMGALTFFLFLLLMIVAMAASAVAIMVTMRAMGHWIARYASEWTNDAWAASRFQAPPQAPIN